MDMYIKTEKETFHFPVNPFAVSINGSRKYETLDILYKGEMDFFAGKAKNIRTMTIDTMFPSEYGPYCRYKNIPDAKKATDKIIKWCEESEELRLIITGYKFNKIINISSYSIDEDANNQGDRYISLDIRIKSFTGELIKTEKNLKPKGTSTIRKPKPSLKLNSRPKPKPKKRTYTVKRGDSLWKISKRFYKKGSKWRNIYNANKKVIGKNPNLIYPGQKFIIPK